MDLATVQKAVEAWTPDHQDQLAAYLTILRLQRSTAHGEELSRRLRDRDPDRWLTLSELTEKLQEDE